MSDFDAGKSGGDAELQEFLMVEKQKAQVNAQVNSKWNTNSVHTLRITSIDHFRVINRMMFSIADSRVQRNLLGQMHRYAGQQIGQQNRNMSDELCGTIHRYVVAGHEPVRPIDTEKRRPIEHIWFRCSCFFFFSK